jgi:hypothetical protein
VSWPFLGIIVALAVSVTASIIDLAVKRDKGLYLRALPLCGLFVVFDAAAALILFVPIRAGAELLEHSLTIAAAVVAGLVAPLLMRTKIPVPFTKGKQLVNAVAMLRRLQIRVGAEIEDLCAAGETAWILDKVLPALKDFPLSEVEAWVIQSINVKYTGPEARVLRRKCIEDVQKVADDAIKEEERKHLLVQILIDRCGRRQVIALVRRAKKWSKKVDPYASPAIEPQALPELEPPQALPELEAGSTDNSESTVDPDADDSAGNNTAEDSADSSD